MKKVFSTSSEVVHLFANKTQEEAKNQTRNIYFNKNSLFSYGAHYKLAQHLKGGAILINTRGYSVTTSKHINEITQASRHLIQYNSEEVLLANVLQEVESLVKKLPRARQNKLSYIARIKSLWNKLQFFQTYLKRNKINKIYWSNNTILRPIIDKRCKAYKRLLHIVKHIDNLPILEKEVKEAKAKQDKKEATKQKQLIRQYRLGKSDFVRLEFDLLQLRYNEQGYYIHTSQNVKLSLVDGLKAIESLEALQYNEEAINKHLKGQKIHHYTITKAQNKALFVGCHKVKFEEIKRLAKDIKNASFNFGGFKH